MENNKKLIFENHIKKLTIEVLKEEFAKGNIDEGMFNRMVSGLSNVGTSAINKAKETGNKVADVATNYVKTKLDNTKKAIDDVTTKISTAYTKGEMEDIKKDIEEFVQKAAGLVAEYNVKAEKVGLPKLTMTGQTNKFANPRKK